jgi:hypothetical protein
MRNLPASRLYDKIIKLPPKSHETIPLSCEETGFVDLHIISIIIISRNTKIKPYNFYFPEPDPHHYDAAPRRKSNLQNTNMLLCPKNHSSFCIIL